MNKVYYTINYNRCGSWFLDAYDRYPAGEKHCEHYIKRSGSIPFPSLEMAHTFVANRQMEKLPCT